MSPPETSATGLGCHPETGRITQNSSPQQEADSPQPTGRVPAPPLVPGGDDVQELLDAHIGREIPGGCDRCEAVQTVRREAEGIYRMTIAHDDGCPDLYFHMRVLPVRTQLGELRRGWHMWHQMDVEQLAQRDDIDLDELIPEARGDRVLAARAWRASILARLEVLGGTVAERLEALEGGAS